MDSGAAEEWELLQQRRAAPKQREVPTPQASKEVAALNGSYPTWTASLSPPRPKKSPPRNDGPKSPQDRVEMLAHKVELLEAKTHDDARAKRDRKKLITALRDNAQGNSLKDVKAADAMDRIDELQGFRERFFIPPSISKVEKYVVLS